ncbi:uncharacterized protein LOC142931284 [Petromyzon marinus]|uniref:uncharacterized protein LOC142931284 n=1 Tax=Petromyzon marinus TaxID=7757 RepID=UPI003F72CBFC
MVAVVVAVTSLSSVTLVEWRPGDLCQAAWSEDGVVYDATIKSVDASAGTCVVVFTGHGNEDELKLADLPPAAESAAGAGGESDAAASCDADSASRAGKESAPSADDYEMPGRSKGGHGARKKGHKQKQSVPPLAYPSPPLSHPPPFPGFPPYGTGPLGFTTTTPAANNNKHHLQSRASPARFQRSWGASLRARSLAPSSMAVSRGDVVYQKGQVMDKSRPLLLLSHTPSSLCSTRPLLDEGLCTPRGVY